MSKHHIESGENLLEKVFKQITDPQIQDLAVRTRMQRMDSTQIASNIVKTSRLERLVTAIQRMYRILSETDQERSAEKFAPYVKGSAGHYTYQVKGQGNLDDPLQQDGEAIYQRLTELRERYADELAYQVLERIFTEHFNLIETQVSPKENQELDSGSLQSADDLEATYRDKRDQGYRGYVANITETCDPENEVQLITKVQVAPNNGDDTQLLDGALPDLEKRTDLETLSTDGGYGSPETDKALREKNVQQIQTAIRSRKPAAEKLHLSDFEIKQTEEGQPTQIRCPQGQNVKVQSSSRKKSLSPILMKSVRCRTCPFSSGYPAKPCKRDPRRHYRFTQAQANVAQRRRRSQIHLKEGRNLRAAVEATVRQGKHPFPDGKLPVRGPFRVACRVIGSDAMSKIRRIQRYRAMKAAQNNEKRTGMERKSTHTDPFLSFLMDVLGRFLASFAFDNRVFCF